MDRTIRGLVSLAALCAATSAAAAGADEANKGCADQNPQVAIIACSVLIESGAEPAANLSREYNNRGAAYGASGDFEHALQDFEQAIKLDHENFGAFINRGNTYQAQRQYDHALEDYNEAIRIKPGESRAFGARAGVYELLGQPD